MQLSCIAPCTGLANPWEIVFAESTCWKSEATLRCARIPSPERNQPNTFPDGNPRAAAYGNPRSSLAEGLLSVGRALGAVLFELSIERLLSHTHQSPGRDLIAHVFPHP